MGTIIINSLMSLPSQIITHLSILDKPEGEYICIATNNIGASEERIVIEGKFIGLDQGLATAHQPRLSLKFKPT